MLYLSRVYKQEEVKERSELFARSEKQEVKDIGPQGLVSMMTSTTKASHGHRQGMKQPTYLQFFPK